MWKKPNLLNPIPTCGVCVDLFNFTSDYQIINWTFWIFLHANGFEYYNTPRPSIFLTDLNSYNLFQTLLHSFYG